MKNLIQYLIISLCFVSFSSFSAPLKQPIFSTLARELKPCATLLAGAVASSCIYGIVHDTIAAKICPAYFTMGFFKRRSETIDNAWLKNQLQSNSPMRLGISWGIKSTWRSGLGFAIPVILAARLGYQPRLSMSDLRIPTFIAFASLGIGSAINGIASYVRANKMDREQLTSILLDRYRIKSANHGAMKYHAVACAHRAASCLGGIAAFGLAAYTLVRRIQLAAPVN